ncbi:MAG: hypothetical protein AB1767_09460 [Bacillota bacterium]
MEMLIVGLVLGTAAGWFWCRQSRGAPPFKQFLQRELGENRAAASDATLGQRVAELEERLQLLELGSSGNPFAEAAPAQDEPPVLYPGWTPPVKRAGQDKRAERRKVLAMWQEGGKIDEIATQTRLGKGEVELIVNLREKAAARRSGCH